jgi:hypothetical protein
MRALLSGLAAAAMLASLAAPATAVERTRTFRTYTCPASGNTLRIIFDSHDDTVTVTRMRQPSIRLRRAPQEGGDFHYVRSNNRHELTGNAQHVRWRVGAAVWNCVASG